MLGHALPGFQHIRLLPLQRHDGGKLRAVVGGGQAAVMVIPVEHQGIVIGIILDQRNYPRVGNLVIGRNKSDGGMKPAGLHLGEQRTPLERTKSARLSGGAVQRWIVDGEIGIIDIPVPGFLAQGIADEHHQWHQLAQVPRMIKVAHG